MSISHRTQHTVLLIEAHPSLRRLIALGLQYRDMNVFEAEINTPDFTPTQLPDLIVLDIDRSGKSDWSLLALTQKHPSLANVPVVVLSWECSWPLSPILSPSSEQHPAPVVCLTKPFDARILHSTIEQLLLEHAPETEPVAVVPPLKTSEGLLVTAHGTSLAPSIWPLVTAAALLLAFIGLMVQIALTAVGFLIVILALLWWTLGPNTQPEHAPLAILD